MGSESLSGSLVRPDRRLHCKIKKTLFDGLLGEAMGRSMLPTIWPGDPLDVERASSPLSSKEMSYCSATVAGSLPTAW